MAHRGVSLPLAQLSPQLGTSLLAGNILVAPRTQLLMGKSRPHSTQGGEESSGSALPGKGRMEIGNFCLFLS